MRDGVEHPSGRLGVAPAGENGRHVVSKHGPKRAADASRSRSIKGKARSSWESVCVFKLQQSVEGGPPSSATIDRS
jgi:hypothetical protein